MATSVVFGGTGYTGGNIVRGAAARGHQVVAVGRSAPAETLDGVRYETGRLAEVAQRVVPGADAVVAALSPRGDLAGRLVEVYAELEGGSHVSGADSAAAVIDEIENRAHHREHLGVAS